MTNPDKDRPIHILMVEDNPGDARLAIESLRESKRGNTVHVVQDGVEAMEFLRKTGRYAHAPRPDLIMLDLNLPKKDGREVLAEIKVDETLGRIPIVALTSSQAPDDVLRTYALYVNCYIAKPVDLDEFMGVVRSVEEFWTTTARLPAR